MFFTTAKFLFGLTDILLKIFQNNKNKNVTKPLNLTSVDLQSTENIKTEASAN